MNSQYAILASGLSKSFRYVDAIRNIDLQVKHGELFGVIGSRGAGKSTLLELLTGLRKADKGDIQLLGMDVGTHLNQIKQRIGVQPQNSALYDRMKVKEALHLFRTYYNKKRNLPNLIEMLGLEPYLNQYISRLSTGLQQRISLAVTIVNDPDIIALDEPYAEVDPQHREEMWSILGKLRDEGKTIIISTSVKDEARRYCDRVALLVEGAISVCNTKGFVRTTPYGVTAGDEIYMSLNAFNQRGESA